jgi:two-component system, OmpR family, osmolarity sensor histidine kinase EnvZ
VNTLFARTVLLSVASLLAVHIGYRMIDAVSLTDASMPAMKLIDSPLEEENDNDNDTNTPTLSPTVSIRPHITALDAPVTPSLHAAVWQPVSGGTLTLATPSTPDNWTASLDSPFAPLAASLPAVLLALCAYWFRQTHRGLRDLARLTRHAGACNAPRLALDHNRCDIQDDIQKLARTLSDLLCRHHQALDDQSTALAAFSRQLDARIARLRSRALNVAQWHKRVAFIEDIELFSNVARQFVDVAGHHATARTANAAESAESAGPPVGVDAWLHDRFFHGASMDDAKIVLHLDAGRDFTLPRHALERLAGNLVGNALAHGAAPVEISTTRGVRSWTLSVRDHGEGIDEASLAAAATHPFARLSVNEPRMKLDGDDNHWGLGLSIVSRLAHDCGATLKLGNHPEGGFWARVILPFQQDAVERTQDAMLQPH